ncbi:hypothetical protein ACFSL4_24565 [Streptomyces caeni]|uniref:Uncharacterized protein n=1 Tax=Streptomyces caeni TaxID=2307231 RepID=A0ABW4IVU9_9ACTN
MVRISHSVVVESVPRLWFEQALRVLHGVARETRAEGGRVLLPDGRAVPDVRLAEGCHLSPGAVYELEDEQEHVRLTVRQWGSAPALRLEHALAGRGVIVVLEASLRDVDRPVQTEISGSVQVHGRWQSLRRANGGARVDLRSWWKAATGRRPAGAPFEARVRHRLARATLRATPRPHGDGRWEVRLVLSLRGRSLLRPVAAAGLLLRRRRLRQVFAEAVEETARQWNRTVPQAVAHDASRLLERVLDAAAS